MPPRMKKQAKSQPEPSPSSDLKKWVNKEIRKCISNIKVGIYFPHLITDLCHRVGMVMGPIEQFHNPTTSIIGDNPMQQFQELQRKQIQD
ncbi:hypothetical protein J1N35_037101 [Gossypium stocksii]|uniref:Uncharacterized protein n=1 Tax=Gossypium stocksii TaxID=47602 RepID=A0A9D3UJE2_9ROSI|nr:hypothetical protein J1N35_037101 [Gossypium stocksii]